MKNLKILSALFVLSCAHVILSSDAPIEPDTQDKGAVITTVEGWQRFNITTLAYEALKMTCEDQSTIASYSYHDRQRASTWLTGGRITSTTEKSALTKYNEYSPYMKFSDISFGQEISVDMDVSPLCQAKQKSQSKVKLTCENGTREIYFHLQKCIYQQKNHEIKRLEVAMDKAVQAQEFEVAAALRDKVSALKAKN